MKIKRIRTRFAPSPTGYLHIGGLRTALYSYFFAKKNKGDFILRIEDTDTERTVPDAYKMLIDIFSKLGIIFDEGPEVGGEYGPYFQSKRLKIYRSYAESLIETGHGYYCFCTEDRLDKLRKELELNKITPMYDGRCRAESVQRSATQKIKSGEKFVIRLMVPKNEDIIKFTDLIRGEISFPLKDIDDQVLLKSDGFPTYHLANVVDDHLMRISHVIRGEEWIPSTPKHILLYKAFKWEIPQFAHVPLLINPDRSKISKRNMDVSVESYLKSGYLPQAIINFVSLLGWNPRGDQEIYTIKELINLFTIQKINRGGAILNFEKLRWINQQYIKKMTSQSFLSYAEFYLKNNGISFHLVMDKPKKWREVWIGMEKERLQVFSDVGIETQYVFNDDFSYDPNLLLWNKYSKSAVLSSLEYLINWINKSHIRVFSSPDSVEKFIKSKITENSLSNGEILWPLRVALTGREKSPPPFPIAFLIGKDRTLTRIESAIIMIKKAL